MESPSTTTDNPLLALIRRQAREYGTKPYLLDARSTRVLRYDQLRAEVDEHRRQLQSWGVTPGVRFAVVVADPLTFASWFLAGIAVGAWVAPLDPTPGGLANSSARASILGSHFVVSDQIAS